MPSLPASIQSLLRSRSVWLGLAAFSVASLRALVACTSLSDVTYVPTADITDIDGGYIPDIPDAGPDSPAPFDAGVVPGYARLAHLFQNGPAVDLCTMRENEGWESQKITRHPTSAKSDGLQYEEVSTFVSLPVASMAGSKYSFRVVAVGGNCDPGDAGTPPLASITNLPLPPGTTTPVPITVKPDAKVTLVLYGISGATGDFANKGAAMADLTATVATGGASVRAFNAATDTGAINVLVGGQLPGTNIKYGTGVGFPYTGSGYGTVDGGIAEATPITITAGTASQTFKGGKLRTRTSGTLFVGGKIAASATPPLSVSLCEDALPGDGQTLSTCTKLAPGN
jgi:hypothetical protein